MNTPDTTPHSLREFTICNGYRPSIDNDGPYKNKFVVLDDTVAWSIEIPGIEPDDVEVFTQSDSSGRKLVVNIIFRRLDKNDNEVEVLTKLEYILTEEETATSADIELGVLHIIIDRNIDREYLEISS